MRPDANRLSLAPAFVTASVGQQEAELSGHHHHDHPHTPADFSRAFAVAIGLNLLYVLAEAAARLWTGSVALLADAGHNLSYVLGRGVT